MTARAYVLAVLIGGLSSACTTSTTSERPIGSERDIVLPSGDAPAGDLARRARVRIELASGYYQQGRLGVALEEARKAIQIDPNYAPAHNLLGLIEMSLNERAPAEAAFQRALQLAPTDSEAHNNYGWFLCQTDRVPESFGHFQAALKDPLYNTPAVPLRNAGVCALRAGDPVSATDYLQRAFQYDPTNASTQYNLALALYRRHDYERAQFYIGRLNRQIDVTSESLWLEIKTEHQLGHRDAVVLLGSQLRRRFPESRERAALEREAFDD